MIECYFEKNKCDEYATVLIRGHSEFGEEGHDIVCAAVSACVQGGFYHVLNYTRAVAESTVKKGYAELKIITSSNGAIICIDMLKTQLEAIASSTQGVGRVVVREV